MTDTIRSLLEAIRNRWESATSVDARYAYAHELDTYDDAVAALALLDACDGEPGWREVPDPASQVQPLRDVTATIARINDPPPRACGVFGCTNPATTFAYVAEPSGRVVDETSVCAEHAVPAPSRGGGLSFGSDSTLDADLAPDSSLD